MLCIVGWNKNCVQDAWYTKVKTKKNFFFFAASSVSGNAWTISSVGLGFSPQLLTSLSHVHNRAKMSCGVTVVVGIFSWNATTLVGTLQNATVMFGIRLVSLGSLFLICSADLLMASAKHITCIRCRWNTLSSSDTAGVYDAVASAQKDCSQTYWTKM